MKTLSVNGGWWQFRDAIAAGEDFNTHGALKGRNTPDGCWLRGRLPRDFKDSVAKADYVVWSYSTPIAWRTNGAWYTPGIKYSVTTSKHQGRIFTAVHALRELLAGLECGHSVSVQVHSKHGKGGPRCTHK